MFPQITVDITVQPVDETEYILSNPAFARELEERMAEYEKKKTIRLKVKELV